MALIAVEKLVGHSWVETLRCATATCRHMLVVWTGAWARSIGLSLAVAAVPEGLPIILTITLTFGMKASGLCADKQSDERHAA